jgi:hypothetical protein
VLPRAAAAAAAPASQPASQPDSQQLGVDHSQAVVDGDVNLEAWVCFVVRGGGNGNGKAWQWRRWWWE